MTELLQTPSILWDNPENIEAEYKAERLGSVNEGDIEIVSLFINGRALGKSVCRVFCQVAMNKDKEFMPAVLLLGEIDKPIPKDKLVYFAQKGYAVFGVDFSGVGENATIYPSELEYCNKVYSNTYQDKVNGDIKGTIWYNYTYNAKRVLNYLFSMPFIDKDNVFVCSNMSSDKIGMIIASTDKRIKAFAMLFGNCWEEEVRNHIGIDDKEEDIDNALREQEERQRYSAGIAPQAYLNSVTCPFLLIVGSNSQNTDMKRMYEAIQRMDNNNQSIVNIEHLMMDAFKIKELSRVDEFYRNPYKKINEIKAEFEVHDGSLFVKVIDEDDFEKIKVFYSRGDIKPELRNWVQASKEENGLYSLLIADATNSIAMYVQADDNGTVHCSKISYIIPTEHGVVNCVRKSSVIYATQQNVDCFIPYIPGVEQDDVFLEKHPITFVKGAKAIGGVYGKALSTYALNDPIIKPFKHGLIVLSCYSRETQKLSVYYSMNIMDKRNVYQAEYSLTGGEVWQKIVLSHEDFKTETNKSLDSFTNSGVLSFSAPNAIVVNNIIVL